MRLTREKIVRLSHQITEVLVESAEVEFVDDRDTIRQQVVQILTATLKDEEKIELEVRKRITSQKKEILEGSEEWDVLHKKYYQDELHCTGGHRLQAHFPRAAYPTPGVLCKECGIA